MKRFLFLALASCIALPVSAVEFNGYRGPDRNGIARADVGLADAWAAGGPTQLWATGDLGVMGFDHTNGQIVYWNGLVYAVTYKNDGRLVSCFDTNGVFQWSYWITNTLPTSAGHDPNPSPWIWQSNLYIHGRNHDVCLNAINGSSVWVNSRLGDTHASPVVVDGIYVQREREYFVGKDALSGTFKWKYESTNDTGSAGSCALWRTPGKTYVILNVDENEEVACVDPVDCTHLWSVDPVGNGNDGVLQTTPMVLNDILILTIRCLDTNTPQQCYRLFPDEPARQPEYMWGIGNQLVKSSGVIFQDHAYWGWTTRQNTFASCIDIEAGNLNYYVANPAFIPQGLKGYGDLLLADGKLYGNACDIVVMAWPNPDAFTPISKTPDVNAHHMTTPTIVNGRMYIYAFSGYAPGEEIARIKCFDVSAPAGAVPHITQTGLPGAVLEKWYSERLWVSSGNGHRTWRLLSGQLPPGILLDSDAHMLEGFPTNAGPYTFSLKVEDENGDADTNEFTIIVIPEPCSGVAVLLWSASMFPRRGIRCAAAQPPDK